MMRAIFLAILASIHLSAQAPAFDVASVKPSPPSGSDLLNINLGTYNHGVVTLTNTTLSECLRFAYGLVSEDQIGGPDWIRDRSLRVDIAAKTSPETPNDQALLMMQRLLTERFHLVLHREPKPIRHLELSISPKGSKLEPSKDGVAPVNRLYRRGQLFYDKITIHTLTVLLSRNLRDTVTDQTGLAGAYDIHLEWTPDDPAVDKADVKPGLPDIYQAVEQQLGLRLESKRTPIEVLVVDKADKVPVAN